MFIGTFQGCLQVECYVNKGPSTGLQLSGATTTTVISDSVPRAFTQCTIAQARVFLHTTRKCMRCDIHDTDLQEALFTVLQASFHVIKGPTACVRVVGIFRRITDIAFHYYTMRQQQLSYVRPADVCLHEIAQEWNISTRLCGTHGQTECGFALEQCHAA